MKTLKFLSASFIFLVYVIVTLALSYLNDINFMGGTLTVCIAMSMGAFIPPISDWLNNVDKPKTL